MKFNHSRSVLKKEAFQSLGGNYTDQYLSKSTWINFFNYHIEIVGRQMGLTNNLANKGGKYDK